MTQRTLLITGVNSGFGRQMTEQLLACGDRVAGTVRKLGAMDDLTHEQTLHQIDTNLIGSIQVVRALPHLCAQGGRRIIQIPPTAGRPPMPTRRSTTPANGESKASPKPPMGRLRLPQVRRAGPGGRFRRRGSVRLFRGDQTGNVR